MARSLGSAVERFWKKVVLDPDPSGCWLWIGKLLDTGYGDFSVFEDGRWKNVKAHRFSYQLHKGMIPDGLDLDHLCRVRACVNPDHLEPVTRRTNLLRGVGFTALNYKKSFCVNGHAYTAENTYVCPDGWRRCRECQRISSATHRSAVRARGKNEAFV